MEIVKERSPSNGNGDQELPATIHGEPIPDKYKWLIPFIGDEPLPPTSSDILVPAVVPQEGERKLDTVMRQLADGVGSIQDSSQFRLFLTTMSKFHNYSVANLILIGMQKPEATRVAGYVTWINLGRNVKRGEKGIAILAPVMPRKPKKEELEDEEEKEEVQQRPVAYAVVNVFDISQTEGKPLPEFDVPVLTGEGNEILFANVLLLAKDQGLDLSFEPRPNQDPGIKGQYSGKEIWIKPDEPRAQQLKTALHELGHYYSAGVFRIPRQDAETIAESAAFAVGAHFGFDSGVRSFPYVALWAQDKKVLDANLGSIRKVTTTMLEGIEKMAKTEDKLVPALKPFEPYHFAEFVLRYNRFADAEIPIYSGFTGRNPLRVPDRIWREVVKETEGEFIKQGELNVFHIPEKERPAYMRAAPTWRDIAMTVQVDKRPPGSGKGYVPATVPEGEIVEMFCQKCGEKVEKPGDFRTEDNMRIFMMTGLCQKCQDKQRAKEFFGETPGQKKVTYIETADGRTMVEWWYPADFTGRSTHIYSGDIHDVIQIPDKLVLCDFCNAEITEFPVAVLWGTHAVCGPCFQTVQEFDPGKPSVIPATLATGMCYRDAWRFLIKEREGHLVHGTVMSGDKRVGHAWVETESDYIWEPETKRFYTNLGFENVAAPVEGRRYDTTEASTMAARTKHFGPWTDEEVSKYLKKEVPAVIPTKPCPKCGKALRLHYFSKTKEYSWGHEYPVGDIMSDKPICDYSEKAKPEDIGMLSSEVPAVIPTKPRTPSPREELEFVSDSPELIPFTIADIGYRDKLDQAFEAAIARAKRN